MISFPKSWAWPLALALALTVALAAGALKWLAWRDSQRGWTVERLEQSIAAEVPPGCDRARVAAWFDAHGIRHDYIPGRSRDGIGDRTPEQLAGLGDAEIEGTESGRLWGEEANLGFLSSGRITVYFFFDKGGRLAGHYVHPFVYSL